MSRGDGEDVEDVIKDWLLSLNEDELIEVRIF